MSLSPLYLQQLDELKQRAALAALASKRSRVSSSDAGSKDTPAQNCSKPRLPLTSETGSASPCLSISNPRKAATFGIVSPGRAGGTKIVLPRRKGRSVDSNFEPLPLTGDWITKNMQEPEHTDPPHRHYSGEFAEHCVWVTKTGDMRWLYKQGFFGKGFLSKSEPEHAKLLKAYQTGKKERVTAKQRQIDRKVSREAKKNKKRKRASLTEEIYIERDDKSEEEPQENIDSVGIPGPWVEVNDSSCGSTKEAVTKHTFSSLTTDKNEKQGCEEAPLKIADGSMQQCQLGENRLLHVRDDCMPNVVHKEINSIASQTLTSDLDVTSTVVDELNDNTYEVPEYLQLSLAEAFFLSFALSCLTIYNPNGSVMGLEDCWAAFNKAQADFVASYVVYHHLRSRGWVPKSGLKFGVDYLAYRKGPAYFHSSFSILVRTVDAITLRPVAYRQPTRNLTWPVITNLNRLSGQVAKEVIICNVCIPHDIDFSRPSCLHELAVQQILLRRWIPEKTRYSV